MWQMLTQGRRRICFLIKALARTPWSMVKVSGTGRLIRQKTGQLLLLDRRGKILEGHCGDLFVIYHVGCSWVILSLRIWAGPMACLSDSGWFPWFPWWSLKSYTAFISALGLFPLGKQLLCKTYSYSETTMLWGTPVYPRGGGSHRKDPLRWGGPTEWRKWPTEPYASWSTELWENKMVKSPCVC